MAADGGEWRPKVVSRKVWD